jgi:hypothetical protein
LFADRADAGQQLAGRLLRYKDERPVVLGLPRGGVPVAYEIARALDAPLDVIVVRKLRAPDQPELGIGAIVDGDQRELRDVVRYRKLLIEAHARGANRVLKALETANSKLGSVVTNVLWVSARAMRKALIAGAGAPEELAELAKRRLRRKRPALAEALTGRIAAHHRFMLEARGRYLVFRMAEVAVPRQLSSDSALRAQ